MFRSLRDNLRVSLHHGSSRVNEHLPSVYNRLQPPGSIRLFRIRDTAEARGYGFLETTIDEAPSYETLSYVWGTPHRSEKLTLGDGTHVAITSTLSNALPIICSHAKTDYLWIDQLCINQDDIEERGEQVALMGEIYAKCVGVLVWLGELPSEDIGLSSNVVSEVQRAQHDIALEELVEICMALNDLMPTPIKDRNQVLKQQIELFMRKLESPQALTMLLPERTYNILSSPWFMRGWVQQEIVLPPTCRFLLAGTSTPIRGFKPLPCSISFDTLLCVCRAGLSQATATFLNPGYIASKCRPILQVVEYMYEGWLNRHRAPDGYEFSLEHMISHLTRWTQTTIEHDKLYAFYGLNTNPSIKLAPSYRISTKDALIAFSKAVIEGTRSLTILTLCSKLRMRDPQALPSWAVDFFNGEPTEPLKFGEGRSSQPISKAWSGYIRGALLYVTAVKIAEIRERVSGPGFHEDSLEFLKSLIEPLTRTNRVSDMVTGPSMCPQTLTERVLRTYLAGDCCDTEPVEDFTLRNVADFLDGTIKDSQHPRPADVGHDLDSISDKIRRVARLREVYVTTHGEFVLGAAADTGHDSATWSDIYYIEGCPVPVVLTRSSKRFIIPSVKYEVHSTCYLEGWMAWKPLAEHLAKPDTKTEEMCIC